MADSSSKTSPLHEPEKTEGKVFGYNVANQAKTPVQKSNPNSPLAAG